MEREGRSAGRESAKTEEQGREGKKYERRGRDRRGEQGRIARGGEEGGIARGGEREIKTEKGDVTRGKEWIYIVYWMAHEAATLSPLAFANTTRSHGKRTEERWERGERSCMPTGGALQNRSQISSLISFQ
jgi:hypothetical protein